MPRGHENSVYAECRSSGDLKRAETGWSDRPGVHVSAHNVSIYLPAFAFRRSAQYFFIRADTAFLAAVLM
jgi:hypothetical protein